MLSGLLMENKTESIDLLGIKSGETDQINVVPAVGAGEVETKVSDPSQAEPTPGDRSEPVDDDPTDGIQGRGVVVEQGVIVGQKADDNVSDDARGVVIENIAATITDMVASATTPSAHLKRRQRLSGDGEALFVFGVRCWVTHPRVSKSLTFLFFFGIHGFFFMARGLLSEQ